MRVRPRNTLATLILAILVLVAPVAADPYRPLVTAKAAILVDNRTGKVLWANNPDTPLPPASTTKIVTSMLALQSGRLDEAFKVTANAAKEPPSKISLRAGWRVRLRDLVYATLLNSANDASVVIAEGLAESVRGFAARMNVHAYALGATNTHFVNPNGLPADDHYSSARDLATMFSHGLENPEFREVLGTRATTITPTGGSRKRISLHSKNRLLSGYAMKVIGKTGWTRAAGKCFVGAGRDASGRELIVAVLGSTDLWGDLRRLLDYGMGEAPEPRPSTQLVLAAPPAGSSRRAAPSGDVEEQRRYFVRVATFRSADKARSLKQAVQGRGFPTRILTVRQNRKPAYQVAVGGYANRQSAEKAAKKIRSAYPHLKPVISGS